MANFKAKFPVLQELFAKNHRGALWPPPPAGRGLSIGKKGSIDHNLPIQYFTVYTANSQIDTSYHTPARKLI